MFKLNKDKIIKIIYENRDLKVENSYLFPVVRSLIDSKRKTTLQQDIEFLLGISYIIKNEQKYLDNYEFRCFITFDIFNALIKQSYFNILKALTITLDSFPEMNIARNAKLQEIINSQEKLLISN